MSNINLLVQFTAQNEEEARYVLASIMFLRLVTKSFRNDDQLAGSPPPVCRLTGHGQNLLPNVPVVVQDFSLTGWCGCDAVALQEMCDLPVKS